MGATTTLGDDCAMIAPYALHHARFPGSCLYIRKLVMLSKVTLPGLLTPHIQWTMVPSSQSCCYCTTIGLRVMRSGPEIIKLFSCSTQLSMKFQRLIKTKILTNKEVSCFRSLRCCIYPANKC